MDCSWLMEDEPNEDCVSESDSEEVKAEVESRLYSVVHYSDLSQPLPPDLAKHYSVQCENDGKLTVSLKNSWEDIKLEEIKQVDNLDKEAESNNSFSAEKDSGIHVFDTCCSEDNPFKRFRYSDVNLDHSEEPKKIDVEVKSIPNINYFKITPSFFNNKEVKNKKLNNLVVPLSFRSDTSDWKDAANESFISVRSNNSGEEKEIIDQMVCALKKLNPKESTGRLYFFAQKLYRHNIKKQRKLENRKKRAKASARDIVDKTVHSSHDTKSETSINRINSPTVLKTKTTEVAKKDNVNTCYGSIMLNTSPFKPLQTTIDLVSEDEVDHFKSQKTKRKWNRLPAQHIPTKWSKEMIKFYTKPSKSKLEKDLSEIFEEMKRTTTDDDWKLDPRDQIGVYKRTPPKGKHKNRKCPNCYQIGHLIRDCPKPRKISTCFLCGQNYHTAYSCPNKICLKCGVAITGEAYECKACYYNTFNCDTPCGVCGQMSHRSEICPDLWRSFHATTEGDKKIPEQVIENKRKYCCNCAGKGHFSHQCPFPSPHGEQISPLVTNYSAAPSETGTTEVVVPRHLQYIVDTVDTDRFLQNLSDSSNALIDVIEDQTNYVIKIKGTFEQCQTVRIGIEKYVNIRKRKRQEPFLKKKRQKTR